MKYWKHPFQFISIHFNRMNWFHIEWLSFHPIFNSIRYKSTASRGWKMNVCFNSPEKCNSIEIHFSFSLFIVSFRLGDTYTGKIREKIRENIREKVREKIRERIREKIRETIRENVHDENPWWKSWILSWILVINPWWPFPGYHVVNALTLSGSLQIMGDSHPEIIERFSLRDY